VAASALLVNRVTARVHFHPAMAVETLEDCGLRDASDSIRVPCFSCAQAALEAACQHGAVRVITEHPGRVVSDNTNCERICRIDREPTNQWHETRRSFAEELGPVAPEVLSATVRTEVQLLRYQVEAAAFRNVSVVMLRAERVRTGFAKLCVSGNIVA
jgi:hypothetical protein